MKHLTKSSLGLIAAMSCAEAMAQMIVYDNRAPAGWNVAYPTARGADTDEFGDQITLAASAPQLVTSFELQYYGLNFSGQEQIRVRFYANDGAVNDQGAAAPNQVLYDSGDLPLPSPNGTGLFTLNNLGVVVPLGFTWTVQFSGISGQGQAGVAVHGPPAVGSSFNDFWERNNGPWQLYSFSDPTLTASFGASVTALTAPVPEPAQGSIAVAIGLAGLLLLRRRSVRRETGCR